jgi:spore germination cell wall hydrolase CwlJ-like protein
MVTGKAVFVSLTTLHAAIGYSTKRQIWAAAWLVTFLLVGPAAAADQAEKAEAAKSKAKVLEKKAATEGSKAVPTPAQTITKPEAQAVDPTGTKPLDDALTCLARSIYWEARGQSDVIMEAIANVIMNRVGHEGFPDTICGVVKEGSEKGACQFSWWCDGRVDAAEEKKSYGRAKEIARKALNRQLKDRTGGALYFHARKAAPDWSRKYIKTVVIGDFVFYKPPGGQAK